MIDGNPNIAEIASVIAEPSRASILVALLDGRMHPASELAYMARIKPQTASFHLSKMFNLGVILMEKQGRHRYYRLNENAAGLLETLLAVAPATPVKSLRESMQVKALKRARTCYDHFAGEFGVTLTEGLIKNGCIREDGADYFLTADGEKTLAQLGINVRALRQNRRSFSKKCVDWSERKFHLAGALGKGLMQTFFLLGWVEPVQGTRAVKVTGTGTNGLKTMLDIDFN